MIDENVLNMLSSLNGRINRLEFIFEANRNANNKIVAALQTGREDVFKMALEASEKAKDAFK